MGARKRPFYRLVVTDSRSPRDGKFLEILGTFDPLTEPVTLRLDTEKTNAWLKNGAHPPCGADPRPGRCGQGDWARRSQHRRHSLCGSCGRAEESRAGDGRDRVMGRGAEPAPRLRVGRVLRALGLDGSVRVESLSDFPDRFRSGVSLRIGDRELTVEAVRRQGEELVIRFAGLPARRGAARLAGG